MAFDTSDGGVRCVDTSNGAFTKIGVYGRVIDGDEKGLNGVKITVKDGGSTESGSTKEIEKVDGQFQICGHLGWAFPGQEDTLTVSATKTGYDPISTTFKCVSHDCDGDAMGCPDVDPCSAVGGIAELPEIAGPEAAMSETTSTNYALLAGIAAATTVGLIGLITAIWHARRRSLS